MQILEKQEAAEISALLVHASVGPLRVIGRFIDPELHKKYDVYLLADTGGRQFVLKADSGGEGALYREYLDGRQLPVPRLVDVIDSKDGDWLIFTCAGREDLQRLDVPRAEALGVALAAFHGAFWGSVGPTDSQARERLTRRCAVVAEAFPELRPPLDELYQRSTSMPSTLGHGDLLPLNALWDGAAVTLIDFEHAKPAPYLHDLGRVLAFGPPIGVYQQEDNARLSLIRSYADALAAPDAPDAATVWRDAALGELGEVISPIAARLKRGFGPHAETMRAPVAAARACVQRSGELPAILL